MAINQLIPLFNSLKKQDINTCRKLIASPVYNTQAQADNPLLVLFEALVKNKKEEIEDEKLFKLAFRSQKFDKKAFSYLKSGLADLLEEFFILKEFRKDPFQRNIYLLKALRQNNMEQGFTQTYEQIEEDISKEPLKNADYHLYLSKLNNEYYINYVEKKRKLPEQFEVSNIELSNYIISQKIKSLCEAISNKRIISSENEILHNSLDNQIIAFAKELRAKNKAPIIIQIYLACYEMLEQGDIGVYLNFKNLVKNNHQIVLEDELKGLLGLLINFATAKLNKGEHTIFLQESFELYEFGLFSNALFNDDILSPFIFKNIVFVASKLRKYEWAKNFIHSYKSKLAHNYQTNFIDYTNAIVFFNEAKYSNTMMLLATTQLEDLHFELDLRRMLVCCYFEKDELDLLDYQLISFKKYIEKYKENLGAKYYNYANFIHFTKTWSTVDKTDIPRCERIINEFKNTPQVAERMWLASKMGIEQE